jgi:hypothetical protein
MRFIALPFGLGNNRISSAYWLPNDRSRQIFTELDYKTVKYQFYSRLGLRKLTTLSTCKGVAGIFIGFLVGRFLVNL